MQQIACRARPSPAFSSGMRATRRLRLQTSPHRSPSMLVVWSFVIVSKNELKTEANVLNYVKTSKPCFLTIVRSFSAIPLGRFAPVSHFSTVDSLVFR
jgi:hypothetical protein